MKGTFETLADTNLVLGVPGFTYADLYDSRRLEDLLEHFDSAARDSDAGLFADYQAYRRCQGEGMKPEQVSDLLVKMAPLVGEFVSRLFKVADRRASQMKAIQAEFDGIFRFRGEVVSKLAARYKGESPDSWDVEAVRSRFEALLGALLSRAQLDFDREAAVAGLALDLLRCSSGDATDVAEIASIRSRIAASAQASSLFADVLAQDDAGLAAGLYDALCRWAFLATRMDSIKSEVANWVSFKVPAKTDFTHLVEHDSH